MKQTRISSAPQRRRGSRLAMALAAAWLMGSSASQAQTQVYYEDFDTDASANFIVNTIGSGDSSANAFFDYSAVGIPSAPNSTGGTTRGLKLWANIGAGGVFPAGVSVSPLNFGITENFEMRFDMWLNYNKSGNGSTEVGGAGYGTAGITPQVAGARVDSVFIGATLDGGSPADYRVYSPAHGSSYQDADRQIKDDPSSGLVYFAGSRNNTASHYVTNFPATPVPEAQAALFPSQAGTVSPAGAIAFKWHDVSLKKVGKTITYRIDGVIIATVNSDDAGVLGGNNILFNVFDTNLGGSTDPDAPNVLFALFDNVRITNFPDVVSIQATQPNASEAGPIPGIFTVTRTSVGAPLTVNYTISGTATNGVDYQTLAGSVTFGVNDTTADIVVTPIDDNLSELTETVILTLAEGPGYVADGSATVTIQDNDIPTIDISLVRGSMYERLTNDYARFRLTRRGDIYAYVETRIAYGGDAVAGVDFEPNNPVFLNSGDLSVTFDVHPIDNSRLDGDRTFTVSVAPGNGYAIGTNTPLTATIMDDERPPETVLWSDNLQADTSANWTLLFGSTNPASMDYTASWAVDYSAIQWPPIPPAPHSGSDTHGLQLTVNKNGSTTAAGLNLYPKGQSFSGNYALRFEMYLIEGTIGTTEYALFGINHSGARTNWFRNSTGGVGTGWLFDGIFFDVESDGAALGDYAIYGGPGTGSNPTPLNNGRSASTLTGVFKSPPWTPGAVGGGVPANLMGTQTPSWADVEVSQIGNQVTLTINKTVIFTYTNTTPDISGNIMLGYDDAYDSLGSYEASVIYANARVISLAAPALSRLRVSDGNAQIDFSANSGDVAGQFILQSAAAVTGPYADVVASISALGGGNFRATKAVSGNAEFYRVRRIY